ncbi:MAG: tetratricopeptide repeat protein [Lysobacterales bacterium]
MKKPWPFHIPLVCLLAACAATGPLPQNSQPSIAFEGELFGEPADIVAIADIYRLSEQQLQDFMAYFDAPIRQDTPAHERVSAYLEEVTINFSYHGDTYTAEDALRKSSGNCLSLAILTTALAKVAGVETGYQLIDSAPVYELSGSLIYRGQHVRTKLYDPRWEPREGSLVLSRPGLLVDYFPSNGDRFVGNIDEAEFNAMYYNNIASDAIAKGDYNNAFWLLRKSLEMAPYNTAAVNAMAITYGRVGQLTKAEDIYTYGIRYLPQKVSLLRNYRVLLRQQARYDEIEAIDRNLAQFDDSNPFDWLQAGQGAYAEGDFKDAVFYFKKAVRIAPYMHESYAGLAKAYYKLGNRSGAKREFRNAREHSYEDSSQAMYQAKLMALSNDWTDSTIPTR